jgi:hypothetical protein
LKNIQIIDGANNATFSVFQATDDEFAAIFPNDQDIELSYDFHERVGNERAQAILTPLWKRPILKREAKGIHGTLYYNWEHKRQDLPASKREVDWDEQAINEAQRRLFRSARASV